MSGRPDASGVAICGIGLLMPGLASWPAGRAILRGEAAYVSTPALLPPPPRLPPAERRRAGPSVRLAMAVADEAVASAGIDPLQLATVFASSGGEGSNCHVLCETLAGTDRQLSPTRFTNSVHNAPAGYWHIAVGSRAASTSLSAYDGSFVAGLVEAVMQVATSGEPVLLVALDVPYPEPLHRLRPLPNHGGVALLLAPTAGTADPSARLSITLVEAARAPAPTRCADPALDALRQAVPAAAALPLLEAIARGDAECRLVLDYLPYVRLQVDVSTGTSPR
jgi:hypothetical protein